jgi:hypothetical protein
VSLRTPSRRALELALALLEAIDGYTERHGSTTADDVVEALSLVERQLERYKESSPQLPPHRGRSKGRVEN